MLFSFGIVIDVVLVLVVFVVISVLPSPLVLFIFIVVLVSGGGDGGLVEYFAPNVLLNGVGVVKVEVGDDDRLVEVVAGVLYTH